RAKLDSADSDLRVGGVAMKSISNESIMLIAIFVTACNSSQPVDNHPPGTSEDAREFAELMCAARERCGCADGRCETTVECEETNAKIFEAKLAVGVQLRRDWFNAALVSAALTECPAWVWEPEQWSCAALVGSKAQGESCTNHGDLQPLVISECKEGLVCNAGRCIAEYPVPSAAQEGDDCGRGDVPGCGKGLYCGEDGLCAVRGGAGSACTSYVGCETNLFCEGMANGTGTCSAKKAPGSSCDP